MRNILVTPFIAYIFIATISLGDVTSNSDHSQLKHTNTSWIKVLTKLKEIAEKLNNDPGENVGGSDSVHLKDSISWEDCGSGSNELAEILSVSFDPNPPQRGIAFNVATKIQLYKAVTGGNVFVNIKYLGYITVLKETLDLCTLAEQSEDSCPLTMGVHESYVGDVFPDFAFSGQYSGTIKAVDDEQNELSCIKVKFTLQ